VVVPVATLVVDPQPPAAKAPSAQIVTTIIRLAIRAERSSADHQQKITLLVTLMRR
jgi:hypothetical protein